MHYAYRSYRRFRRAKRRSSIQYGHKNVELAQEFLQKTCPREQKEWNKTKYKEDEGKQRLVEISTANKKQHIAQQLMHIQELFKM